MAALYNEEKQVWDLLNHISPYVERLYLVDDESTDATPNWVMAYRRPDATYADIQFQIIKHTGLPETVKAEALKMINDDPWIIMLDADERFADGILPAIVNWINSEESKNITHVWFNLEEAIDGRIQRHFLKCRLFRRSAVNFSDSVHVADSFSGNGANFGWTVLHYKTSAKQIMREKEYLETYDRLVNEGKITPEKREELKGYHYFIR